MSTGPLLQTNQWRMKAARVTVDKAKRPLWKKGSLRKDLQTNYSRRGGNRKLTAMLLQLAMAVAFFGFLPKAYAQCDTGGTCSRLSANGGTATINKFGVCKVVTNNSTTNEIMVPYNTATEWCGTSSGCSGGSGTNSFVERTPSTVSLSNCASYTWVQSGSGNCVADFGFTCTQGWANNYFTACSTTPVAGAGCSIQGEACNTTSGTIYRDWYCQ